MEKVWDNALSFLRAEVNEQTFSVWFSLIKQLSCDGKTLVLSVPNKFIESWIREKFFSLITSAVEKSAGKPLEILIKPEDVSNKNFPTPLSPKEPTPGAALLKSAFGAPKALEPKTSEQGLNPKYTFDSFVVGASNRFAHAASLSVCESLAKSYNPLFIHGGVGLGKTHLLHSIGNYILSTVPKVKISYISSETFTNQLIDAIRTRTTHKFRNMYRTIDVLLLDDVQFIAGKESTQEEFFHTFNALHDAHKQIVLCSDRHPRDIADLEERLVSRFAWGLIADVQAPDFETRMAILQKKSENESAPVPQDVLYFLAEKVKTNIREMEGALIRVVAYAKLTGTDLTVDFAREILKGMIEEEKKVSIGAIQEVVGTYYNLSLSELKSKKRTQTIAYPRQVAMYLCRKMTDHSLPEIGVFFGGRDHTTVLHAYDKINKEMEKEDKTRSVVDKLTKQIKNI
jgi:chromosomal replication initiator protein